MEECSVRGGAGGDGLFLSSGSVIMNGIGLRPGLCALRVHAEHNPIIGRGKENKILVRPEYAASIGQTLIRVSSNGSGIRAPRKVYVYVRFDGGLPGD